MKSRTIAVISAHPDDEVLGAGGTLIKHRENGDKIIWIIATEINERIGFSSERVERRRLEIEEVSNKLKADTYLLGFDTMSLTGLDLPRIINKVSKIFQDEKPEIIYCLNRSDAHSDHRILFDAVMSCTKSFRYPFIRKVLLYECISETEFAPQLHENLFIPNYFVNISSHLEEKLELMQIYSSEVEEPPFPRSLENIEALARFRGSTINQNYAEAFQVVKIINS